MNLKIKKVCQYILKFSAWILFLFSIFIAYETIPDLLTAEGLWVIFIICLGLIFSLGYILRKNLFAPFRAFAHLTFERKMMLLVVLAILIGIGFYCWSVWEKQIHISPTEKFERKYGL